ncbi:T-lymphocyte surface antigen Ly-9-like isoform X1 [Ranitomeya imitator]|uniref:T-lymphocyte surface antigen Ly-9-like isoform X1 n=1 Tax=Ranitomeya imitator TaxID=111125 RepID=UPI0037E8D100
MVVLLLLLMPAWGQPGIYKVLVISGCHPPEEGKAPKREMGTVAPQSSRYCSGVLSDTTRQTLSAKFGGSILFQVNIPKNTEITSVFWSHMQKMVAIDKSDHLNVINPRFLKRLTSQQPSFSLKLSNLTEEDSGIYDAKIYTNGPTIERSFKLQVCGKYQTCGVQWTKSSIQLIIILGTLATFFNAMT